MEGATELLRSVPSFLDDQAAKCAGLGLDVDSFAVSHVAIRTRTWNDYIDLRSSFEAQSFANRENVWNRRPISKLLLKSPIRNARTGHEVTLIELIAPFHQRVYKMGLEHVGYVVGPALDPWARAHRNLLTGQQFQSQVCDPYYVLFDDYTHVKFYRTGLEQVCAEEGHPIEGFRHADWAPRDPHAGPYEIA